jgi:predicted unusual protein kinase regulating ubiquinone biosynthesis (AarF/ABC1/UbiB family)
MSRLPLRGVARTAVLASIPAHGVALALEGAVRRRLGQDPDEVARRLRARGTDRTRRVLGQLKGGALKAGQLLSTLEALFPPDPEATWREALTALQESNPGIPWPSVRAVLDADLGAALGPEWSSRLCDLDPVPVAAASIGQVHRAVWDDGTPSGRRVAVKVQYPRIREALLADVRALSLVTRAAALVAPGVALPPLVAEMRTRLLEELDYRIEASHQRRFAAAYARDDEVLVPGVVCATGRVLVQDWIDGTPLAAVAASASRQRCDRAGLLYQRFLLSGPARCGLLHSDPHPGNFRLMDDGRLGVLDFGSCLELDGGLPPTFGRLITALLAGTDADVLSALRQEGLVRPGARLEVRKLRDYLAPFSEPAGHETFRYSRDWLRANFARVNDPRDPDFAVALQLTIPPEHLFTHRVWLGLVGVLCQLEATVPVRPELERWLPGFTVGPRHPPAA